MDLRFVCRYPVTAMKTFGIPECPSQNFLFLFRKLAPGAECISILVPRHPAFQACPGPVHLTPSPDIITPSDRGRQRNLPLQPS